MKRRVTVPAVQGVRLPYRVSAGRPLRAGLGARGESGDWGADSMSPAGPDAAPDLSPYEQRYVLVKFRQDGGALATGALDELARTVARLRGELRRGR